MDLLETASLPRHALASRLIDEVATPGLILLSGPSQSGKSHTLRELAKLLTDQGTDYSIIRHDTVNAQEQLERSPLTQLTLIDGLDLATEELAWSLTGRLVNGATCICTLSTESSSHTYQLLLERIIQEQHPAAEILLKARSFRIAALASDDAETIASTQHGFELDSVTVAAVSGLSWGRPGWLLDLLHLANAGKIRVEPHATVGSIDLSDMHLPVLSHAMHATKSLSNPAHVAAAIVLSELEPRSIDGAADLVGAEAVSALRSAGLLLDSPTDAQMVGVPEIFAAPMRLTVEPALHRRQAHNAASVLLVQELIGVPLPDRESAFCARAFGSQAPAFGSDPTPDDTQIQSAHAEALGRLTSTAIAFGRPEARDLLQRVRNASAIGDLTRAKAATVLRGPVEGLRTLRATRAHSIAHTNTIGAGQALASEYLHAQLLSLANLAGLGDGRSVEDRRTERGSELSAEATSGSEDTAFMQELASAELLFRRWNDNGNLGSDTSDMLAVAQRHRIPEVALLAEQLVVLEGIRWGQQVSSYPAVSPTLVPYVADTTLHLTRIGRVSTLALEGDENLQDLLAAAAVTEGVIALLSATNIASTGALHAAVRYLPGAAFHELWVRHLTASINALAAGNVKRTAREWRAFERRLPSFLPQRLLTFITVIGNELERPPANPRVHREPTHQLLDYFRGALDLVQVSPAAPREQFAPPQDTEPLPIFQLVSSHLDALETQNPAALLRVAEHLQARGLWAPAVYALQAARAIFIRRRASGSVVRCDSRLKEVELAAQKFAPWFTTADLSATPRSHLTKREADVALLGSSGFSNKQIAERLQCSVRTVESHLASARAKLGAANRSELARRLEELGYR